MRIVAQVIRINLEDSFITKGPKLSLTLLNSVIGNRSFFFVYSYDLFNGAITIPICSLTKYYSGDKIRKNGMGGHVARVGGGDVHVGFWWGNLRERF